MFYVLPCVILLLCFSVLSALRLPRCGGGGKIELVLLLFVRLFNLRLFGLVLSVSSPSWCLRRAAVCNCGTPWIPFFFILAFFIFCHCFSPISLLCVHYENTPIQIYRIFYHQINENFQIKNSDTFLISA